jgi:hypothetical protein
MASLDPAGTAFAPGTDWRPRFEDLNAPAKWANLGKQFRALVWYAHMRVAGGTVFMAITPEKFNPAVCRGSARVSGSTLCGTAINSCLIIGEIPPLHKEREYRLLRNRPLTGLM